MRQVDMIEEPLRLPFPFCFYRRISQVFSKCKGKEERELSFHGHARRQMALACDKIMTSVRNFTSILGNGGLLLALMQAPSLHSHRHETTQRHGAAFLHTHVAHVEAAVSTQPEFRDFDPDEDAHFPSWFSTSRSYPRSDLVICTASNPVAAVADVGEWRTMVLRPSAHDPPLLNAIAPRGPPV